MHTVTLYLPPGVEASQLRNDLEGIITKYKGKKISQLPYALSYAVVLEQTYEIPSPQPLPWEGGTIITYTNDVNMFREERLHIPGGALWFNAKIVLSGFNEETLQFQQLKERFEYLNTMYRDD